jgi:hypothetical protein
MKLPASPVRDFPATSWIVLSFLVVTLLGIWPALTNGQPFFYADTTAYVRGADLAISKVLGSRFLTDWATDQRRIIEPQTSVSAPDLPRPSADERKSARRVVLAGRSIIYGALLYFGEVLGGMWFSVIIQSLVATYLIFIFTVKVLDLDLRYFLISCAVLIVASPLPFFASFLMPDVFAGFLILGFAILATSWDRLSPVERAITSAIVLFSVLSHITHLTLLIVLATFLVIYVAAVNRSEWIKIRWFLAVVAGCVVIAILWEAGFDFAVKRAFGIPPVRPPFAMAKLVSMLGEPAVSRVCGSNAFVVCRFQDRFPISAESFLWSQDERTGIFSVADVQTKRLLEQEQLRFALAIIPPNLGQFVAGVSHDALQQLISIGLSDFSYHPADLDYYRDRLPPDHFDRMTSTLAARSDDYVIVGRKVLYATLAIGAIITAFLLAGVLRPPECQGANEIEHIKIWHTTTYILSLGIMLNAIICGGMSTVQPRYEARVIWLIQLPLITGIVLLWKRKTEERCLGRTGANGEIASQPLSSMDR